jgi:hypothetical protein
LAKVAIFTTNVDAENQTLINHKTVCGALSRHFCQTRVISWPSVFRGCEVLVCLVFRCHCRVVFWSVCVACALLVLKILEGEILKNNFSLGGKGGSSIAIFGLCVALCELQLCLHLCDGLFKWYTIRLSNITFKKLLIHCIRHKLFCCAVNINYLIFTS